jgi:hypothetical protein
MSNETAAKQVEFFRRLFGNAVGWLNIGIKSDTGKFSDEWFAYPGELTKAILTIQQFAPANDIYYCPSLFIEQRRKKEHVREAVCIWADLDTCDPTNLLLKPTFVLETSPARFQALWVLDEPEDTFSAEELARRIAYYHQPQGADTSGWDITQLLRVPWTTNHKVEYRKSAGLRPPVKLIIATSARYRPQDFKSYPPMPGEPKEYPEKLPDIPNGLTGASLMQKYADRLTDKARGLFSVPPVEGRNEGWSGALWSLECSLFEAGLTPLEVFIIARDSACNKYARDQKPMLALWKDVTNAANRVEQNNAALTAVIETPDDLLRANEKAEQSTIIEQYIDWASRQTDAATQYHQAGAFMLLSGLLASNIRLQLKHMTVVPNLWFMILGNTTLTRKSTAMRLASGILNEISPETVMATDGSIEGILTAISTRPGEASIFQRDEFAGMLEAMTRKEYMAGMQQEFLRLYDGDTVKRRLRSGDITVKEPIFILYAGGIRDRLLGLLDEEHVESGFIPRFLFFLANSEKGARRRGERFSNADVEERDLLIDKFRRIHYAFNVSQTVTIGLTKTSNRKRWFATIDDAALNRWNDLNDDLIGFADTSENANLFYPVMQRLGDSVLKAALLLSAARAPGEEIVITLQDIITAIYYGEQWLSWSVEVLRNIGKTPYEDKLERITSYVTRNPGVSRQLLMRAFKLNAQNAKLYLETLEQRGLIRVQRNGMDQQYLPITEGG